jgi:hypothetical protein
VACHREGVFTRPGRRESLETLPDAAVEEAQRSGGWCKVIADWSFDDEPVRRYGPTVPADVLREIVRRVHAIGGYLLDQTADQGTVLVPTMCADPLAN